MLQYYTDQYAIIEPGQTSFKYQVKTEYIEKT